MSQKFIKVYYIEHVFKVLQFFPCIRIRINHLEKQNGTLYGSLKQICQKSAGLVILQKHEVQCDGMRTWIEFLDHYDNMGSNNIMTIYFYDKVISCPYHWKYPGGLEQFATNYEEAYTGWMSSGNLIWTLRNDGRS